jgi:D-sedoheptulose 7-phosphate isomerase
LAESIDSAALLGDRVADAIAVFQRIAADPELAAAFPMAVDSVVEAITAGGKILFCGNGGSSADAQHLAAELVGKFTRDRAPWPALSLSDNVAALTAISNDYSYTDAYERGVRAFARPGDVLICLSTSGRSANVVAALLAANELGVRTIALTGPGRSPMADAANIALRIDGPDTARIQEGQKFVGHVLVETAELRLTADR